MSGMRRWFPIPAIYFIFTLIFPAVRWWQRPDDALTRCAPVRWRVDGDGLLACDRGRPLRALERLSLGLPVDVHDLSGDDWRALVGRAPADRLETRRRRVGRLCVRRITELDEAFSPEILARLPPGLHCGSGRPKD